VIITQPSILPSHFFRILGELQGIQEFLDLAVQHVVQIVYGQADPVVGDAALGKIVGPDLGAPVAGADEAFPVPGDFFLLFPDLLFV
jgi:hypothetical protein